ncbi:hypothetical protein KEM54_003724 [Ascosphaera aggregata]|nr:hypothetical protein KEM54_003724 [Ascosphaera aggregata]
MHPESEKEAQLGTMSPVATPGTFQKGACKVSKRYWVEFLKAVILYGILIWIPACWILGSTYKQKDYVKNMKIIVADLDQSGIGKSVTGACEAISGDFSRPSFEKRSDVTSYEKAYDEVWKSLTNLLFSGNYWGGVVIHEGATDKFVDAFLSGDTTYNASSAVTVIYNSARWPATTYGFVSPVLSSVVTSSQPAFKEKVGQPLLKKVNGTITPEMYQIFFNPYSVVKNDIHPFEIGARYFLGTAGIVFPTIITFFIALALRSAYDNMGYLRKFDGVIYRAVSAAIVTFIGGLFYATWVYMFHENAEFTRKIFILIWMVMWLYGFACYWFFDIVATGVAVPFIPPVTLTFVVMQVTASAFPNTIKHRFYRVDYVMPSFNAFELFISVLTHGSTLHADRNIPALCGWIVFWFCIDYLVHWKFVNDNLKQQAESEMTYGSDVTAGR